jgi:aspartate aminotransferase
LSLSRVAAGVRPSATLALNAKAKELARQGEDVVNFTVGEPDFDTPDNIKQAAHRALQSGLTKYAPAAGMPELREAIAAKLKAENGLDYSPAEVLVSNGAKQALYMIMLCLLQEGDEALIPAPYWVSYVQQARVCGATAVVVDACDTDDLKPTPEMLERAITERSRLLVLNSPCNPTGVVLAREEIAVLVEVALDHDLWIVSDEIYEKLVFDGLEHVSAAGLSDRARERVITVNGMSKTYAMTGWRLGYAAGPEPIIKAAAGLQSHMTSGADSIAQKAGVEALTGSQESVGEMRDAFEERRRVLVAGLNEVPGISCLMPGGAFYAFPDCSALLGHTYGGRSAGNSLELCAALLDAVKVALVPGSAFGAEGFVRLLSCASIERIEECVRRVAAFVNMQDG